MMKYLFSVIIPVYNVEKYLTECIESILVQISSSTPPIEIILVDDGSIDRSSEICDYYSREVKSVSIRVIHQENMGLLAARRSGYREALGDYYINLDSDDILADKAIVELVNCINTTHADVVFFNLKLKRESSICPYYEDVFTKESGCFLRKEQILHSFFYDNIPVITSMAGKVFRRDCIDLDYDYSSYGKLVMGEDTLQTAEIISRAQNFYYLNKSLYIYRVGSGVTNKYVENYYETFKQIFNDVYQRDKLLDKEKYQIAYCREIVSTGIKAITQSKYRKGVSYVERKRIIMAIVHDSDFIAAKKVAGKAKDLFTNKQKLVLLLLKIRAYWLLHFLICLR